MKIRPTIRTRLTAWYAVWLLLSGIVLLSLAYLALGRSLTNYDEEVTRNFNERLRPRLERDFPGKPAPTPLIGTPRLGGAEGKLLRQARVDARSAERQTLALELGGALAILVLLSVGGGWVIAGRALRPVAEITSTTKRVAAGRLDERIGLRGPSDEVKELADAFDEMLARLEAASKEQQRFIDSASHELRTPLATMRSAIEAAIEDERATEQDLREMAVTLASALGRSEQLVAGLLTLSRSEHPVIQPRVVDLAELAEATLQDHESLLAGSEIRTVLELQAAPVQGDPFLLEGLVGNLVENAIKFNRRGGHVAVRTRHDERHSVLEVSNSGDWIAADAVPHLFEPFYRPEGSRSSGGAGLGLAIARRVARAHGGTVRATARVEGGICVRLDLPAAGPRVVEVRRATTPRLAPSAG